MCSHQARSSPPRIPNAAPPLTQGQPPDLFNLPFVLAWLVQQKSYPPRWSAKQVAAAGQPAAEGGLCNLAAGAAKPPLAQSVQQMNQVGMLCCGEARCTG